MRYREFNLSEDELFELNMSPTNLTKMAANIDARVGMEFELIVPNYFGDEEDEFESEPDYEYDESFPTGPGWARDVISFFRGGSMGSSTGVIQRKIDELNENFWGWMDEKFNEWMDSDSGNERALEIATEYVSEGDYDTTEEYEIALRAYIDEHEDDIREQLLDEFNDEADDRFVEYLEEEDIEYMSSFANEYDLEWPYWTEPDYYGGGGTSIDDIADDFSNAIDRPVNSASSYHGATRRPGHYVVEPDGSLHGDDGESGLEFVSPPLTVPEMLSDIDKVIKWANRVGAYTNDSTGLHMNVSVPNQQNLDYVKLAMFLGDNYVLEQFGREGNTYCKSALKKIVLQARNNPDRVEEMMRQFQGGLNQLASKILHTGSTEKFTSINNRDKWIEFRGPGGDWMSGSGSIGNVKNTLLRAVVALDVATKPEEYKQEYYKKLYKTLTQGKEDDSIQYFAKYAAGELPKQALKSFVRQIQQKRQIGKQQGDANLDVPFVWMVFGSPDSPYQSQGTEVIATSPEQAKARAILKWSLNIAGRSVEEFTRGWRAVPQRPATELEIASIEANEPDSNARDYLVYPEHDRERGVVVRATSDYAARQIATMEHPGRFSYVPFADIRVERHTQQTPRSQDQEFTGTWEVVSRNSNEVVHTISGIGNLVADAERHAARWQEQTGFDDPVYVRPQMRSRESGSTNRPGPAIYSIINNYDGEVLLPGQQGTWTYIQTIADNIRNRRGIPREDIRIIDMEQNRAYLLSGQPASAGRDFPAVGGEQSSDANYEIVDRSTVPYRPVFRFIANTDQEASRKYSDWLAGRGIDDDTETYGWRRIEGRGIPGSSAELARQRAIPATTGEPVPAGSVGQERYRVTYTGTDGRTTNVTVSAANSNAAMDYVRRQLDANGYYIRNIEAEPVNQAQGTGSLPPGNARWLILDRNDQEVYSFINTTNQGDANQYARQWMTTTAPRDVRDRGPFTIVPAR